MYTAFMHFSAWSQTITVLNGLKILTYNLVPANSDSMGDKQSRCSYITLQFNTKVQ